ncbi:MAG: Carnitine operon protein CaiE [Marinobacterium sp. xm-d-530]|nr:MAG: Carnitine operon protein CaiE [Marinobacterium sp. xm-d-530]
MPIYQLAGVTPVIHPTAYVHPTAVIIGDVHIGEECYIGPLASLRGDFGAIKLGKGVNIQDCVVVHSFKDITVIVEDFGHIGHGAILHGCTIRKGVLVGMSATVMDKAEIGARSFIGAHSFVKTGDSFPEGTMILGTPAKAVRELTDEETAWKHKGTEAYIALAKESINSCIEVEPLKEAEPNRKKINIGETVLPKQDTLKPQ